MCECRGEMEIRFRKRSHGNLALSELTSEPVLFPTSSSDGRLVISTPISGIEVPDR